ncbi:protein kinase [Actinoplanes sp. NPDC051851]|uniref:serine/threonine-protein kinase n=1 Tax=Actinoplanes sp. NPDC051851 TaxID=3154753 RepID=UPI00342AE024
MEEERKLGGRYRLEKELGRGGMAVVWRATDEVLNRQVAVKVLAGRYTRDERFRERILHEARASATLSHPNIAQIYDFGESGDDGTPVPYVVMELINGPTLQQRIARGPLPPRTVFRICGEVALALAAAHEDGLVHRDIKLANVMVTPSGAKVVDFGIAAVAGPAAPDEGLLGTPAYLAPERLTGGAVEPASDVYALGVLLYRLLAGESPWTVETTTQMLTAHVYVEPAPLPDLPGVPPAIADLVERCLAKDPADRPVAAEVSGTLGDAAEAAQTPPVRVSAPEERTVAVPAGSPRTLPDPLPPEERPAAPRLVEDWPTFAGDRPGVPTFAEGRSRAPLVDEETRVTAGHVAERPGDGGFSRGGGDRSRVPERRRLLAGGALAAAVIALPALWWSRAEEPAALPETTVVPPVSERPKARHSGPPSSPRGTRASAGASLSRHPSASASGAVIVPSVVVVPTTSGTESPSAPGETGGGSDPVTEAPPEGTRLDSVGGSVIARCVSGDAELIDWAPAEGFVVERVDPGPALTVSIVFTGDFARYRMSVTCFSGKPSAFVLPV